MTYSTVQLKMTQNDSKQTNYHAQRLKKTIYFPQNNSKQDYLRRTVQYDSKQLKTGL